jgi:cytochrome c peroxidase
MRLEGTRERTSQRRAPRPRSGGRLERSSFVLSALVLSCAPEIPPISGVSERPSRRATSAQDEPISALPVDVAIDRPLADLGSALFSSPILSEDGRVACSSCHTPEHSMADGRSLSLAPPRAATATNSTTLYNVRYFATLGWTGRFRDLGEHLDALIANPQLMNSSWPSVVSRLEREPRWVERFEACFSDGVSIEHARAALVEYERSLVTPQAAFDRWLSGDPAALSNEAAEGYAAFKAYGCISCHQGVAIGANLFQRLGVMRDHFAGRAARGADLGRFAVTGREEDRHVFRVPSLRNVALTGPYLHDGSVASLRAVVELMADVQLGIALSGSDLDALTAFLAALTGGAEAVGP